MFKTLASIRATCCIPVLRAQARTKARSLILSKENVRSVSAKEDSQISPIIGKRIKEFDQCAPHEENCGLFADSITLSCYFVLI